MGWRSDIQTIGGRRDRPTRSRSLGAATDWTTLQTVLDSTLKPAFVQASGAQGDAQVIAAFKSTFASPAQILIAQLQAAGLGVSDATAALNALTSSSWPATTAGALRTSGQAALLYVRLQDLVYRGAALSGAISKTAPATTVAASPTALLVATEILIYAIAGLGCSGLAGTPEAVAAFQIAATWLSAGWMSAPSGSGVYDAATAAIAKQIVPTAPDACVSTASSSTSPSWADIQTLLDANVGVEINLATNKLTTSPGQVLSQVRGGTIVSLMANVLNVVSQRVTVPTTLSDMVDALEPSIAVSAAGALKAITEAVAAYVAIQQFIYASQGALPTVPPLAAEAAAGVLVTVLNQTDGCANPNVPTAVAAFQTAYRWTTPSVKFGSVAYDAATKSALADFIGRYASGAITVPAVCAAAASSTTTTSTTTTTTSTSTSASATGPTYPTPGAVTSPAPSSSTTTPAATIAPAASDNSGYYVAGGLLLLLAAAAAAVKFAPKHR